MALGSILPPGYRAFKAVQEQNQQAEAADLQKAAAAQGLLAQLQAQQREQAFAADLASLSNPTQEQIAQVAARHVRDPKALMQIQQQSLDRNAQIAATKEATLGRMEMQRQFEQRSHEARLAGLKNDADKIAETARHNQVIEGINAQIAQIRGEAAANRPAQIIQTPSGPMQVRDGKAAPITGPDGKPVAAPPKPQDAGLSPENAGKVSMSQQAVESVDTVRGIVFDKEGKMNRSIVGAMNLPIVAGLPGNSQARIARSAIRNAVEAKLRIETGAAATESEVERTLARFLPTIADTDASAKFKLDELQKFFKTSLSMTKGVKAPEAANNDPLGIR